MNNVFVDTVRISLYKQILTNFKNILFEGTSQNTFLNTADDDTISKLKLIGMIEKNQKLNVSSLTLQQNSYYTAIHRTIFQPDNKYNTLNFIQKVIIEVCQLFAIKASIGETPDELVCKNLLIDLIKSKQGISNLAHTYKQYQGYSASLLALNDKIDSIVLSIKDKYPNLYPSDHINLDNENKSYDSTPKEYV